MSRSKGSGKWLYGVTISKSRMEGGLLGQTWLASPEAFAEALQHHLSGVVTTIAGPGHLLVYLALSRCHRQADTSTTIHDHWITSTP